MQIKSAMTEDEIRAHIDPLGFACHPVGKLKMASTIICNESENPDGLSFETFRSGEVYALGEIIDAAADEIQFLVDVAQEKIRNLEKRVSELKDIV